MITKERIEDLERWHAVASCPCILCDSAPDLFAAAKENLELRLRLFEAEADAIYTDKDGHLSERCATLETLVLEAMPMVYDYEVITQREAKSKSAWVHRAESILGGK